MILQFSSFEEVRKFVASCPAAAPMTVDRVSIAPSEVMAIMKSFWNVMNTRKIEGIKMLRQRTGWSLKEANDFVNFFVDNR